MPKKEKILIICAHPDDETIGCGGTISKYSLQGKHVETIIMSYGEGSHPWLQKKKLQDIRVNEANNAGKILGVKKTTFLGVKDGDFKNDIKRKPIFIDCLADMIKEFKPNKIFTHSFDDVMYYDHKVTYETVMKAVEISKYKNEILLFNVWNPINFRKRDLPKLTVDITKTFSKKLIVQLTPVVYIRAILHGLNMGFKFAEIFYKLK